VQRLAQGAPDVADAVHGAVCADQDADPPVHAAGEVLRHLRAGGRGADGEQGPHGTVDLAHEGGHPHLVHRVHHRGHRGVQLSGAPAGLVRPHGRAQGQADELPPGQGDPGELAALQHVRRAGVGEQPDEQLVVRAPDQAVALPVVQPVEGQRGRRPLRRRHEALRGRGR
jgi:hypothetical protein